MFWERDRVTFYENENAAKIISRNKIKLAIKEKDFISSASNKLLDEFIKFEFHIEYKKGYWYPLKDGNLPHEDPQGIFDLSSIVRKKWTEYDENTKVGWRGPMLKWKFVEEYDKKVYNCK